MGPFRAPEHPTASVTLDTYSHAIPALPEVATLIAGLVFSGK